jgi:hypothetical protein
MQDFVEVHSMQGAMPNRGGGASGDVYRTVCAEGETLPTMFETSLKDIQATKISEIAFAPVIYMEEEILESWALGPVAAVSGMIALLMGVFVFRRALGPRKSDKYRKLMKTGMVDCGERRFGEMGGNMDDGSVDSAFYSESDEENDGKGKDHEKRMRAKLRAEREKAKLAGKSSKKFMSTRKLNIGKSSKKMDAEKQKTAAEKQMLADEKQKLAIRSGSAEDTDSFHSTDSPVAEKKRAKKSRRSSKTMKSSMRSSTSSSHKSSMRSSMSSGKPDNLRDSTKSDKSSKKSSKRGRDKREGGDNARIVQDNETERRKSIV